MDPKPFHLYESTGILQIGSRQEPDQILVGL
jgi:hypothetical protein